MTTQTVGKTAFLLYCAILFSSPSHASGSELDLVSPSPGSTLTSPLVKVQWTASAGATEYWLSIGKSVGGMDYWNSSVGNVLSVTVDGLPEDSSTMHVRVYALVNGAWPYRDYTVTAATFPGARVEFPLRGGTISSAEVEFTWADVGASEYWLDVRANLDGGGYLYNASTGLQLSVVVPKLPAGAAYVRLWSLVGGTWYSDRADFTILAENAPRVQPTPKPFVKPFENFSFPGQLIDDVWNWQERWYYAPPAIVVNRPITPLSRGCDPSKVFFTEGFGTAASNPRATEADAIDSAIDNAWMSATDDMFRQEASLICSKNCRLFAGPFTFESTPPVATRSSRVMTVNSVGNAVLAWWARTFYGWRAAYACVP